MSETPTEDTICCVCYADCNKSTRAPTSCPYCKTIICRTCLQTYLLGDISDIPRCVSPECGHGWEREFLDNEFTRTFRLTTYKEHREKVLIDRERARLPETQEDVVRYRTHRDKYIELKTKASQLEKQIRDLTDQLHQTETEMVRSYRIVETFGRLPPQTAAGGAGARAESRTEERAAFIKPCPADGCKGFLSTAWKCGLCELWTCPDCHELKGADKHAEHTCDPDKVATVRLIEKSARPCPKCGVNICKIDGCDQMWCTACNTAFDWRSGRIATGPVHNPHYFEWLRSNGRNPHAAPDTPPAAGGCGAAGIDQRLMQALGIRHGYGYRNYYPTRTPESKVANYLLEAWRILREFEDEFRHHPRATDINEKYRQLRVRYMAGDLTEEEWKHLLQRSEKDSNFTRATNNVYETYIQAARDILMQLLERDADREATATQIDELVKYCNECLDGISKRFGRKTKPIVIRR